MIKTAVLVDGGYHQLPRFHHRSLDMHQQCVKASAESNADLPYAHRTLRAHSFQHHLANLPAPFLIGLLTALITAEKPEPTRSLFHFF